MSLADLLNAEASTSVTDVDGRHSMTEVDAAAEELAKSLREVGVQAGQAVGVSLPNTVDVVTALFAVWKVGGVYVPINPRLTPTEVEHLVEAVDPMALVDVDGVSGRSSGRVYEADVALVQFTSGTTGAPKPVLLTHGGVLSLLDNVLSKLRGSSDTPRKAAPTNLIPVSLSLWAGIYQILFALRVGAPIVVMDGFEPQRFAELVAKHEVKSVVLPPAAMTMLVDDEAVSDLAPVRFVRSITAPLSPLQARRFRDKFSISVLNSYGQTEIGGEIVGWNAADSREFGDEKLKAVGRPHEGVSLRTDPDTGEVQVQTPSLSSGYADGRDLSDRLTDDGWFRTGDVGHVDDDGFLWLDGRVSDMINRGGLKVFPAAVEEVIRLSPDVADVAVVGVGDERLGEVPWAFVVGVDGAAFDADSLKALCRGQLAGYKVPVRFEPIDALPRNEVGKVLLNDLRGLAADLPPSS